MTKTSTSLHFVNYHNQEPAETFAPLAQNPDDMFYDSIKPKLDQLIRNPSDETIEKILAYSRKK